jgi:plastocyanin
MAKIAYLASVVVLALAGLAAVASCGAAPPAGPGPSASPPPETGTTTPASVEVEIANFAYSPATITVSVGTTVTWTNKDSVHHTVTTREPLFDSGGLSQNQSFSYTFNQKGDFEYYCTFHPNMTGKVIVE